MSVPVSPALRLGIAVVLMSLVAPATAKTRTDNLVANGKPVDCVQINSIRQTDVRDDRTIDFILNGNKVYRNILPNSCPSLGFERRFMYKTSLSQLCSVDIITVLYSSPNLMRGASCGLGKFQPMKKIK
ncbi:hypothetical protein [Sphingobium agri]|jgi:hypothetical protein|uniref:Uncharacterized protein n=1 Tax=Sphingobium agri TaxID=2933566 RepID=A0ABT0DW03_9SPHN|nr:hypothetical protein [Sphingobium agri]MCK0531291.1 hypothetical protein [Sphingobium agri]